ncbi:MAG: FeoA family protein [Arenicellaceae bacterium]|nr:FeoA family protein [Arenicellaceae bacterium]
MNDNRYHSDSTNYYSIVPKMTTQVHNQDDVVLGAAKTMWDMDRGEQATVAALVGVSASYELRLKEIGIFVGAPVVCVNRPPMQAPKVFQICDGIFSLDRDLAGKVVLN